MDELEFLHRTYGANQFTFYDDAFTVDQGRVEEICSEIQKRKLKIKWDCGTRVDMVTKELLGKIKAAGCIAVWFGVESGSQKVINSMGKGFSIAQTIRAFNWAKELGLMTVAIVILGFPGETRETALATVDLVQRISPEAVGYYIATPYPGTPMYDFVKKNGWLKITDFDKYDTATPTFETPALTMQELRDIREQAFQRFFLRPSYVIHMFLKGGVYGFSLTRTAFAHLVRAAKSSSDSESGFPQF